MRLGWGWEPGTRGYENNRERERLRRYFKGLGLGLEVRVRVRINKAFFLYVVEKRKDGAGWKKSSSSN